MVRVPDVYFVNKDIRALRRRLDWLTKRIEERDVNAGGTGFDRAERSALTRLLSQVEEKGKACDPPSTDAFDSRALSRAGWSVKYLGHSNPKPWTAAKTFARDIDFSPLPSPCIESTEAATFSELEALAAARDAQ